ncbi:MAG TPA: glycoside hydrolase family 43 protein [Bacteroidales bacterium]|nr:glycoside hydrolase family 43 protein [Bacteroidales bacterium]
MKILLTLISVLSIPVVLTAQTITCRNHLTIPETRPNSVQPTYTNPVISGFNPDPSVCRVGDDYYLATSSFEYFPGVPIYHSKDLVNWELIGHALTRKSQLNLENIWPSGGIFAPTLRYHKGTFYMITTVRGGGGNFYVTAKHPEGPWSDPVWVDEPVFDPDLFFDDNGKVYYTRRSEFDKKGIVQAEIDIETGKLLTPLKLISKGLISPDCEGPHIYKMFGKYYLMMAEGGTRALHMETIARSDSPSGPWEPCPHNPILANHTAWQETVRATGHADLVQTPGGSWWMVHLATRHPGYDHTSPLGRETFLEPVEWEDGWPIVNHNHTSQIKNYVETLPLHPWPEQPVRDDFDSHTLGLQYAFIRNPDPESYSLTERDGYLRLHGNEFNTNSYFSPVFVGRRQKDLECIVSTRMIYRPANGEEAGLTAFMDYQHHYDILITRRGDRVYAVLRKTIGDVICDVAEREISDDRVILGIDAGPQKYTFWFQENDGGKMILGTGLTQYIGSEIAGTFTGMFFGVYASGNGKPAVKPADFDWFDYQPVKK